MLQSIRQGDFLIVVSEDKNYETGFYNIVDTSGPNQVYNRVTFETGNGNMSAVKTQDGYKVQGINIPHSVQFVLNIPGINPMNVKQGQRVIMRGLGLDLLGIPTDEHRGAIMFVRDDKAEIHLNFEGDGGTQTILLKWGLSGIGRSDWMVTVLRGNEQVTRSLRLMEV